MNGNLSSRRRFHRIGLLLALCVGSTNCHLPDDPAPRLPPHAGTEIGHILNCRDAGSGAINNLHGEPTWVVPGEMGLAVIALHLMGYVTEARQACEYLASVQDQLDGAWYNQYDHQEPFNKGKSPRHTAQVLAAFFHCGYANKQVTDRALAYLKECIINSCDPNDGCLGGGKDQSGAWLTTEWLSDNVFAAKAFQYYGLAIEANRIKATINAEFLNPSLGCWYQTKSGANGSFVMDMGDFGWINFAPANWNLTVAYPPGLVRTIQSRLQIANGAFLENELSNKLMPGIGLQAHLAARATGSSDDFSGFYVWLRDTSGLVQTEPDANGDAGGIIDWVDEKGGRANWWERFIDTSAFVVFLEKDFNF